MPKRRTPVARLAPFAVLAALLTACATDAPTAPDQGLEQVRTYGRTAVNPEWLLLQAGCTRYAGPSRPGTIGLKMPAGPALRFDCNGVAPGLVREAMANYLDAKYAADGNAHMQLGAWNVVQREYCYATGGWWQEDGTFYLPPGESLYDCFMEETYTYVPENWDGSWPTIPIAPGDGGGSSPPPVAVDSAQAVRDSLSWQGVYPPGTWTLAEVRACLANLGECIQINAADNEASSWAQALAATDPEGAQAELVAAMRSAYYSAMTARDIGSNRTVYWNTLHETEHPDRPAGRICQERFNNAYGITIAVNQGSGASNGSLRIGVQVAADNGQLRTSPGCSEY